MATTTSKPSKVGSNFYTTSVTTNTDGSLKATTSRTDAQGNNGVPVTSSTVTGGVLKFTPESGATAAETAAFNNPASEERKAYTNQVQSQNPYGPNPNAAQKQAVNGIGGNPNAATNSPTPPSQAASPPTPDQKAAGEKEALSFKARTRKKYESLKYPEKLSIETQDVIKFTILQYKPSLAGGQTEQTGRIVDLNGIVKGTTVLGSITLPIPAGINDGNVVGWSMDEMSKMQELAAGLVTGVFNNDPQKINDTGKRAKDIVTSPDGSDAVKSYFGNLALQAPGLSKRSQGATLNNNQELLFGSPGLRNFSFQFSFYPRGPKEAIIVRKIIRTFKQSMSVKRSETSLLLKSPHTFAIQYMTSKDGKAVAHPYLNRFKECALTSCSVDYTPDGTYMTYSSRGNPDGDEKSMTAYRMTLSFSELEPLFDDEYGESDYDNVGF
jgi:hypothetical protein